MTLPYEFQMKFTLGATKKNTYIGGNGMEPRGITFSCSGSAQGKTEISVDGTNWIGISDSHQMTVNKTYIRRHIFDGVQNVSFQTLTDKENVLFLTHYSPTSQTIYVNPSKKFFGKASRNSSLFWNGTIDMLSTYEKRDGEITFQAYNNISPKDINLTYCRLSPRDNMETDPVIGNDWIFTGNGSSDPYAKRYLAGGYNNFTGFSFGCIFKLHIDPSLGSGKYRPFFIFPGTKYFDGTSTSSVGNKETFYHSVSKTIVVKVPSLPSSAQMRLFPKDYITEPIDIYMYVCHKDGQVLGFTIPAGNSTLETLPFPCTEENGWTYAVDFYDYDLVNIFKTVGYIDFQFGNPKPGSIDFKGCAWVHDGKIYPYVTDDWEHTIPLANTPTFRQYWGWSSADDIIYTTETETVTTDSHYFTLSGNEGHYYIDRASAQQLTNATIDLSSSPNTITIGDKTYSRDATKDCVWTHFFQWTNTDNTSLFSYDKQPFETTIYYNLTDTGIVSSDNVFGQNVVASITGEDGAITQVKTSDNKTYSIIDNGIDIPNVQPTKPVIYTVTVNPTPTDAHVLLRSSLNDVLYQRVEGDGSQTVQCPAGFRTNYQVTKTGYMGVSVNVDDVQENKTINVTLPVKTSSFTVTATPNTATVTLTDLDGEGSATGTGSATLSNISYNHQVHWTVDLDGYVSQSGEETITSNTTKEVTL